MVNGNWSSTPVAYRSSDGLNWSGPYTLNNPQQVSFITFANNQFMAFSSGIDTSPDGISWTASSFSGPLPSRIVSWNGLFVGLGGGIVASRDLTNWTSVSSVIGMSIAAGDQGFVAVCSATGVLVDLSSSPDGTNWTARGFDGPIGDLAFGNNTYVVVGNGISQIVPTNSQASPLLSGQMISQGFKLSALSQPNYSYHIQSCTNLASTNWWNIYSYTSTQAVTVITDSIPVGGSQDFYRIVTP